MKEFSTVTYGKWILAGEHAVLRGSAALVFPLLDRGMSFTYSPNGPFQLKLTGERGDELQLIVYGLLEKALEKVERHRDHLNGTLTIESNLPLGAGMGGSAALCVGIARFFAHLDYLPEASVYEFSRSLEDLFHGESSGVDIAVAMEGKGIRFMRGGERTLLPVSWQPNWYLSYSGKKGVTAECVRRVKEIWARSRERGEKIDEQMREAVSKAEEALASASEDRLSQLAHALDLARDCFFQWGLCEGALEKHLQKLTDSGALAVKPTGSGGGGYVLSLWKGAPPEELQKDLIRLPVQN